MLRALRASWPRPPTCRSGFLRRTPPSIHLCVDAEAASCPIPSALLVLSGPSGEGVMLAASVPPGSCLPGTWAHVLHSDAPPHAVSPSSDVISFLKPERRLAVPNISRCAGKQVPLGSSASSTGTHPTSFISVPASERQGPDSAQARFA